MVLLKTSLLLMFVLFVSACTPSDKLRTENYYEYKNYSFKLIDNRPESEKDSEILSISVTNCAYGIYRIGDTDTTPDRITYLKNELQQHRSKSLKGLKVKVKGFTIHKNLQMHLRQANIFRGLLTSSFECNAKENEPGGFSSKENPASLPAAVIEIELEIAGRSKNYRIVHFDRIEQGLVSTSDTLIPTAMDKAIEAVLKSLKS